MQLSMQHRLILILVALVVPACCTSKAYVSEKVWTSSGCSGASTLIHDGHGDFFADGTCTVADKATSGRRRSSPSNKYSKVLCAANTASTGYTSTDYTDSACTAGASQDKAESTDTCTASASLYKLFTCTTTSATVGAVEYVTYSADGCAESEVNGAGFFLVNSCKMNLDGVAWEKSSNILIENGVLKQYQWTTSANKDCSGTGTAVPNFAFTPGVCQALEDQWIKVGNMIDGASIDGYSTLPGSSNSGGRQAALKSTTMLLGLVICFGFIWYE